MSSARLNSPQTASAAAAPEPATQGYQPPPGFQFGTVKEFGKIVDGRKVSYGWITDDRTGKDVFVHFTGILRKNDEFRHLRSGQRVQFRMTADGNRQKAVDVEVIG